jgi:hypothetical protein
MTTGTEPTLSGEGFAFALWVYITKPLCRFENCPVCRRLWKVGTR